MLSRAAFVQSSLTKKSFFFHFITEVIIKQSLKYNDHTHERTHPRMHARTHSLNRALVCVCDHYICVIDLWLCDSACACVCTRAWSCAHIDTHAPAHTVWAGVFQPFSKTHFDALTPNRLESSDHQQPPTSSLSVDWERSRPSLDDLLLSLRSTCCARQVRHTVGQQR